MLASILLFALACGDEDIPTRLSPDSPSELTASDTAFGVQTTYVTSHGRNEMGVKPAAFTIATEADVDLPQVEELLRDLGTEPTHVERIGAAERHHLIRFADDPQSGAERLARLSQSPAIVFATPVRTEATSGNEALLLGYVSVKFHSAVGRSQIDSLVASMEMEIFAEPKEDGSRNWYNLFYARGADPLRSSDELYAHPLVEWASPGKMADVRLSYVPNDTYYGLQYYLKNTATANGVPVDINVEAAWDYVDGTSLTLAVIDDGVDGLHEDIAYDWDLGHELKGIDYMASFRGEGENDTALRPYCDDRHGTAVTGIAAARHNAVGVAGVAPGVTLRVARTFRLTALKCGTATWGSDSVQHASEDKFAEAIRWAWNTQEADVIVNSWGQSDFSTIILDAIRDGITYGRNGAGTVMVFAAGNYPELGVLFPARMTSSDPIISVSAITKHGGSTDYEVTGAGEIDVVGMSSFSLGTTSNCHGDVVVLDRWEEAGCLFDGPDNVQEYSYFGGTSAAAPQVGGIAALVLDRSHWLTAEGVKDRVRSGADYWGDRTKFGEGKANAAAAVFPISVLLTGETHISQSGNYEWSASVSGSGTGDYSYVWERRTDDHTCNLVSDWAEVGGSSSTYEQYESDTGYDFGLRVKATDTNTGVVSNFSAIRVTRENDPPLGCPY